MVEDAALTVRLSAQTKDQLAEPVGRTRRTRSFVAAEAIAAFVEREPAIVERIEHGRAQVRAGAVIAHDEVAREVLAIIEATRIPAWGGVSSGRTRRVTSTQHPPHIAADKVAAALRLAKRSEQAAVSLADFATDGPAGSAAPTGRCCPGWLTRSSVGRTAARPSPSST